MQVILKRDAFIDGTYYTRGSVPQTIPDKFKDILPPDALIVSPQPKPVEKTPDLREEDQERAATDISRVKKVTK